MKSHTSNVFENKCHKCEATFDNIKILKNHMIIAHELNNQKCIVCGSSFETKGKLKSHISRVHEKWLKKPDLFKLEFYIAKEVNMFIALVMYLCTASLQM